jgi:acetoin utilization deacetylase AcuC-like enzyme
MSARVVYDAVHVQHDPDLASFHGQLAPVVETPARAESIREALEADDAFALEAPTDHGEAPITAVHDAGLVTFLREAWDEWLANPLTAAIPRIIPEMFVHASVIEGMAPPPDASRTSPFGAQAAWIFDASTPIVSGTYAAARAAVDVALTAADAVLEGDLLAYGLCRPPGHHAARAALGGFCYLNNAAIAAEHLVRHTGEPVAILDLDYHHGNGTQQIFWARGDVLYVSLHADPARAYPYVTGFASERGGGAGEGTNVNVTLPPAADDDAYLAALDPQLDRIAAWPGSMVIVSLGFDTYHLDPICDLSLTADGYHEIGRRVAAAGKHLVVLQEGGYHVTDLGTNARAWLRGAIGLPFGPTHG